MRVETHSQLELIMIIYSSKHILSNANVNAKNILKQPRKVRDPPPQGTLSLLQYWCYAKKDVSFVLCIITAKLPSTHQLLKTK